MTVEIKRGKFRIRMSQSRATRGMHMIEKQTNSVIPTRFGNMTAEDLHDLREAISEYLLVMERRR